MTEEFAGAYAVIRHEVPAVYLAEDIETLEFVLALHLVAQLDPRHLASAERLEDLREALLNEQWGDAMELWIEETDTAVDVYDQPLRIYGSDERERFSIEMRLAPLFIERRENNG